MAMEFEENFYVYGKRGAIGLVAITSAAYLIKMFLNVKAITHFLCHYIHNQNKTSTIQDRKKDNLVMDEPIPQNELPIQHKVPKPQNEVPIPQSVNYHFTRQCNYSCGFCFHTAKNSFVLPIEEAKRGLRLLKEAGMEKMNFSGGEPFLQERGRFVGELTRFCKQDLQLPSVSIVSNGSLITQKWFREYGKYLDILAISCDSFDPEVNAEIGRQQGKRNHIDSLLRVRDWCYQYQVAFKINSVINQFNKEEDMVDNILNLRPIRWKVFQCLLIGGENSGEDALRNAERFVISDDEFDAFLQRHADVECLVPESNIKMQNSYLILDECMRFLDCTGGQKVPSPSILDVGVACALDRSGFDERMFLKRGGRYTWSKADMKLDW